MTVAMNGNTIRKGFRVQDAQLDALLEELVRRLNAAKVDAQTLTTRVKTVEEIGGGTPSGGGAWGEITGTMSDQDDLAAALAGLASLTIANRFMASQTVSPLALSSSSGVVAWNLNTAQNAMLATTENITGWTVTTGGSGRFLSLRLSAGDTHTITWGDSFHGMDTFQMPASGKVSVLSFRLRSDLVLEFLGQSPAFDEWEITEKIEVALGLLAASGTGKITRKATETVALPPLAATGTIKATRKATMSVALGLLSADGTGNVSAPGTFSVQMPAMAAAGTLAMTRKSSGATAALNPLASTGTGSITRKATMSVAMPALAASGSGTITLAPRLLLESGDFFLLESGDKLIL